MPPAIRGQTLGLHEPMLKFVATTYPKPEAVSDKAKLWQLPVTLLPTTPTGGVQWNTNRVFRDASVTVIGLFLPGAYAFSQGQLTNAPGRVSSMNGWTGLGKQVFPGRWQYWATHGATNYTMFLRWSSKKAGTTRCGGTTLSRRSGFQGPNGAAARAEVKCQHLFSTLRFKKPGRLSWRSCFWSHCAPSLLCVHQWNDCPTLSSIPIAAVVVAITPVGHDECFQQKV